MSEKANPAARRADSAATLFAPGPLTLSLPEQIAAQVAARITSGAYAPGQRIMEQAVAAEFAVSRGPVREALEGCDLVLVIMDVTRKFDPRDQFALDLLRRPKTKAFLILNKVDLIREKSKLLPLIEQYRKLYDFAEVVPISALKRNGLDTLLDMVIAALPAGPAYFPEDQITDQPARFMAAEIIREQVLVNTSEEIPYATTVIVDNFEEGARLARIAATIYCEREGQKGILVGKGGSMLKKIGTSARLQIERMLGTKVFLELYVKAEPGWRDSRRFVEELDWRRQLEHRMMEYGTPQEKTEESRAQTVPNDGRNQTED